MSHLFLNFGLRAGGCVFFRTPEFGRARGVAFLAYSTVATLIDNLN
jgi:hypothetical protein